MTIIGKIKSLFAAVRAKFGKKRGLEPTKELPGESGKDVTKTSELDRKVELWESPSMVDLLDANTMHEPDPKIVDRGKVLYGTGEPNESAK